jgi:Mrp family chromosome partitioning ATPase
VDALPLAHHVDDVVLVCRVGMTSLTQLGRLADLLEENAIEPRGFVLIGVHGSPEGNYYLAAAQSQQRVSPPRSPSAPRGNNRSPDRRRVES